MKNRTKPPAVKGYEDMEKILTKWNAQSYRPKVYVLGHRVHHGLISVVIGLYGLYKGDAYLFGVGLKGVEDDIEDVNEWLNFEKGGDPNSLLSIV